MNLAKIGGASAIVAAQLTNQEWILILGILITVLGMVQDYLQNRKQESSS